MRRLRQLGLGLGLGDQVLGGDEALEARGTVRGEDDGADGDDDYAEVQESSDFLALALTLTLTLTLTLNLDLTLTLL